MMPSERERESKTFYYIDEDHVDVTLVVGLSCGPENSGYWWCPKVGVSAMEGAHLFERRDDAVARLRAVVRAKIDTLEKALSLLA